MNLKSKWIPIIIVGSAFVVSIALLAAKSKPTAVSVPALDKKIAQPASISPVKFSGMMNEFGQSLATWNNYNMTEKNAAVQTLIDFYKTRQNTVILEPADFYREKIDESVQNNPTMRSLPLAVVIQVLAVMEYDFYNGEDKDQLARRILGDGLYEANKRQRQAAGKL